jgi:nicotinamidase-related amidase
MLRYARIDKQKETLMENTALLIIDVQNDYFPGGKMVLPGAEEAVHNIQKALGLFRDKGLPIVHIQHESVGDRAKFFLPGTEGQKIHTAVKPLAGEAVMNKNWPNSFFKTELLEHLQENNITRLVITGMMTFMCVDATTRAAKDFGFECVLLHDCTAAPTAEFGGVSCTAEQVKAAFTCALAYICDEVISVSELADKM